MMGTVTRIEVGAIIKMKKEWEKRLTPAEIRANDETLEEAFRSVNETSKSVAEVLEQIRRMEGEGNE